MTRDDFLQAMDRTGVPIAYDEILPRVAEMQTALRDAVDEAALENTKVIIAQWIAERINEAIATTKAQLDEIVWPVLGVEGDEYDRMREQLKTFRKDLYAAQSDTQSLMNFALNNGIPN